MTIQERFWSKVEQVGNVCECWPWSGSKRNGYGLFRNGRVVSAHRFAYEDVIGKIPRGLTLDHLCMNRACCNPFHLEPVTKGVNTLRGNAASAINARKTLCFRGHELVQVKRQRYCRTCNRQRYLYGRNKK